MEPVEDVSDGLPRCAEHKALQADVSVAAVLLLDHWHADHRAHPWLIAHPCHQGTDQRADSTMMCPDNGAVDHVGASFPLDHLSQRFEHRLEHAGLGPASMAIIPAVFAPLLSITILRGKPLAFKCPGKELRRRSFVPFPLQHKSTV